MFLTYLLLSYGILFVKAQSIANLTISSMTTLSLALTVDPEISTSHGLSNGLALTPPMGCSSWNQFAYVLFCEISATKVRTKTIAIATAAQAIVGIVMTVAIPYMLGPDSANWRWKIGSFYGALSVLYLIWAYFSIPETKGRTYEQLDLMFEGKVKMRAFKNYKIT